MTKTQIETLLRNDRNLERALLGLLARQTVGEQRTSSTVESNGRGFNANHAPFLTSVAMWVKGGRRITLRQARAARPLVAHYWRQVGEILAPPPPAPRVIHLVVVEGNDMSHMMRQYDRFQPFPGITQHH